MVPTGNAVGPNKAIEFSRAPDWSFTQRNAYEAFEQILDFKPVPSGDDAMTGASGDKVEPAVPAAPQDKPDAGNDNMPLNDEDASDGFWTAAFAESDSPLLARSIVETDMTDASVALAVVLGGFWLTRTATSAREDTNGVFTGRSGSVAAMR